MTDRQRVFIMDCNCARRSRNIGPTEGRTALTGTHICAGGTWLRKRLASRRAETPALDHAA